MVKRGYFFTLDAFIAVFVIVTGILVIFSAQRFQPYASQTVSFSQDLADSVASMKLGSVDNPFVSNLRVNYSASLDSTLLQEIGELSFTNRRNVASWLVGNISKDIIPEQYGFNITFNGSAVYSRGSPAGASVVISSRRIVFGLINNSVAWGPYNAMVIVWQD